MIPRSFALAMALVLSTGSSAPAATVPTALAPLPATKADCLAAGGRWARGGLSPHPLCFLPTADGGKACAKASDCESVCLSETRTCAAERPRFGCYGYLDENGSEITICVD